MSAEDKDEKLLAELKEALKSSSISQKRIEEIGKEVGKAHLPDPES